LWQAIGQNTLEEHIEISSPGAWHRNGTNGGHNNLQGGPPIVQNFTRQLLFFHHHIFQNQPGHPD